MADAQAIRLSIAAFRGHLTRRVRAVDTILPIVIGNATQDNVAILRTELQNLTNSHTRLVARMDELYPLLATDQQRQQLEAEIQQVEDTFQTSRAAALNAITDAQVALQPPPAPPGAPPPAAPAAAAAPRRINDSIKPKELSLQQTPAEFEIWERQFRAFYGISGLDIYDMENQQAFLFACLDSKLVLRIRENINNGTPIFGDQNSLSLIHI